MTSHRDVLRPAVAVVGGGPAGLAAATALRQLGIGPVLVLERQRAAGGVPRTSGHIGYGVRDLRRVMTGPQYAERIVQQARDWGSDVRTGAMATHWAGDRALLVTSPAGRLLVEAEAVVLATGARERSRSARMIPGDRPSGVLTTGLLQDLVHGRHERAGGLIGLRAVVVGAELVSWSAVLTLREAGCATVAMTTLHERPESYAAFSVPGRTMLRVPVVRRTRVTRIVGKERVEAVEFTHEGTGQKVMIECDTVVFTGDWIPDNELARMRGLDLDPGSLSPVVDTALRTSAEGVFAAGNLLHPVDTADVAALDGRHAAAQVASWLGGATRPADAVLVRAGAGFAWVAPGVIRPGDPAPPRGRLLLWPTGHRAVPRVSVRQGGRLLARRVLPWPASPGRVFRVPWSLVSAVRPGDGDVIIGLD
ncbi:MAG: FAD-dependent oxidoreductase [Actinomycetota bacterium]|nr:FAD-dependent oxidoreductase [Actinomycetota bacterium]